MTQKDAVINFVKQNGGITSMEAFEIFGITRLSSIIFKLRKMGYSFKSERKTTKNRYNNTVNYARYVLEV